MGAIINIFKSIIGAITALFSKQGATPKVAAKKGKDGFLMEAPAASTPAPVAPAAAPVAPVAKEAKGGKKAKGKAGKAATAAAAAAVATVAGTAATVKAMDPVDIINAAIASTAQSADGTSAIGQAGAPTFAEMNAVPMATSARRRPGANMTGFMDMAKTMRTR
jgi:hypothetical protein